jgi:hypothetical protein
LIRGTGKKSFSTASRLALSTHPIYLKWIPEALSLELKRPACEADHSAPSSVEFKQDGLHSPICLQGVTLNYLSTGTALILTLPSVINTFWKIYVLHTLKIQKPEIEFALDTDVGTSRRIITKMYPSFDIWFTSLH